MKSLLDVFSVLLSMRGAGGVVVDAGRASTGGMTAIERSASIDASDSLSAPRFEHQRYQLTVPENRAPAVQLKLHATQPTDARQPVLYSLFPVAQRKHFAVDQTTGELSTVHTFDYEQQNAYELKIVACLANSPSVCGATIVEVAVKDENDEAPVFEGGDDQRIRVTADLPVGTEIVTVHARDNDRGANGRVSYALSPPSNALAVDFESGAVSLLQSLPEGSLVEAWITATDGGEPKHVATTKLTISTTGQNPSAPEFDKFSYESALDWPLAVGQVVATVRAQDPDPGLEGRVSYRLVPAQDAAADALRKKFDINRETGQISLVAPIDSAAHLPLELLVEAADGSPVFPRRALTVVRLRVSDQSAVPLHFLPLPATIYISTDKPEGSIVLRVTTVSTHDKVQFSVEADDRSSGFRMDNSLLVVAKKLKPAKHNLTIRARSGAAEASHRLEVVVTGSGDKYPVFPQLTYDLQVPMHARFPTIVHTFDARLANGTVEYSAYPPTGLPDGLRLDPKTGTLTATARFVERADPADTIFVVVRARNVHFPTFFSDVGVALSIVDRVRAVRFSLPLYRYQISENAAPGTLLDTPLRIVVAADDKNSPPLLSIMPDRPLGIFPNGSLYLREKIDAERMNSTMPLVFTVWAALNDELASTKIQLKVNDANEFTPRFGTDEITIDASEDLPSGAPLGSVAATDLDVSQRTLNYTILDEAAAKFFTVSPNGTLFLASGQRLDRERQELIHFQLRARDVDDKEAFARVTVHVIDANDNVPRLPGVPITWKIRPGDAGAQLRVPATDVDASENARLSFAIVEQQPADRPFLVRTLEHNTGLVWLSRPLRTTDAPVRLVLEVSDAGRPALSSRTEVRVELTPAEGSFSTARSENRPPDFVDERLNAWSVRVQSGNVNATLATLKAVDRDDSDKVTHSLKECHDERGSNALAYFALSPADGEFSLRQKDTPAGRYECDVLASDGNGGERVRKLIVNVESTTILDKTTHNHVPVFDGGTDRSFYVFWREHESNAHRLVGRLRATDPDPDDQLQFSIQPVFDSDGARLFSIDGDGVLRWHDKLPADPPVGIHRLQVVVEDSGRPRLSATANVTVLVRLDDTAVHHTSTTTASSAISARTTSTWPLFSFSLEKDAPIGTVVGEIPVPSEAQPSLADISLLSIDTTGRISTFSLLGDVKKFENEIIYRRIDDGTEMGRAKLEIELVPETTRATAKLIPEPVEVEGKKPRSGPHFRHDTYFAWVPEGSYRQGAPVALRPEPAAVNDFDMSTVHFSLADEQEKLPFYVRPSDGQLVAFELDREQRAEWMLTIQAQDESGKVARARINVTVLDVNDELPEWADSVPSLLQVVRSAPVGSTVGRLAATDGDTAQNAKLTYALNNTRLFDVDAEGNVLVASDELRNSNPQLVPLLLTARDGGRPPLSADFEFRVAILSDYRPHFVLTPREIRTDALTPGNVIADLVAAEKASYSLNDSYSELLLIDVDGQLRIGRRPMSTELGRPFPIRVTARNVNGTDQLETAVIFGGSQGGDERRPFSIPTESLEAEGPVMGAAQPKSSAERKGACRFSLQVFRAQVEENRPGRSPLLKLKTTCDDSAERKDVHFTLVNAMPPSLFTLDPKTGDLAVNGALDREQRSTYLLTVALTSGDTTSRSRRSPKKSTLEPSLKSAVGRLRSNEALVVVAVLDENDNAPVVVSGKAGRIVGVVDYRAPLGSTVMRVVAVDTDEHADLEYSLLERPSNSPFTVDPKSGDVQIVRSIVDSDETSWKFELQVTDGKFRTNASVTIYRLSPSTNLVVLGARQPADKLSASLAEQVLQTAMDGQGGDDDKVRLLAHQRYVDADGRAHADRSHLFVYAQRSLDGRPVERQELKRRFDAVLPRLAASALGVDETLLVSDSLTRSPPKSSGGAVALGSLELVLIAVTLVLLVVALLVCLLISRQIRRSANNLGARALVAPGSDGSRTSSSDKDYMVSSEVLTRGPRPYDVTTIRRRTAQRDLSGIHAPDGAIVVVSRRADDEGDEDDDEEGDEGHHQHHQHHHHHHHHHNRHGAASPTSESSCHSGERSQSSTDFSNSVRDLRDHVVVVGHAAVVVEPIGGGGGIGIGGGKVLL